MALKPLFLVYNETALSVLDATGMAFRKALCLERSHLVSSSSPPPHPSIHPLKEKSLQYLRAFSHICALSIELGKSLIVLDTSTQTSTDSLTADSL